MEAALERTRFWLVALVGIGRDLEGAPDWLEACHDTAPALVPHSPAAIIFGLLSGNAVRVSPH